MSSSKEGSPKEPLHSFNSGISDAGRPRGCMFDPVVVALMARIANVTQLPRENFEEMQVVRYRTGEHCKRRGSLTDLT